MWSRRVRGLTYAIRDVENWISKSKVKDKVFLHIGDPVKMGLSTPEEILKCLRASLGHTEYSDSYGPTEAREAVADFYERRGVRVLPEDVYLTMGVTEGIRIILEAAMNPGDVVLLPRPFYPQYFSFAHLLGLKVKFYDITNLDLREFERKAKTSKAIIVINPNNPLGTVLEEETLERMKDIGRRKLMIFDEIYSELTYEDDMVYAYGSGGPHVVLSGISKIFRVPGLRVGWMLAHVPTTLRDNVEKLLRARLSGVTPFMCALPCILRKRGFLKEYIDTLRDNADMIDRMLRKSDLEFLKPRAAYYGMVRVPYDDKRFAHDLAIRKGVLTVPGSGFGMPGYVRIVFAGRKDYVRKGIERMKDFAKEQRRKR